MKAVIKQIQIDNSYEFSLVSDIDWLKSVLFFM